MVDVPPQLIGGQEAVLALLPASAFTSPAPPPIQQQQQQPHVRAGLLGWWQRPNAASILEMLEAVVIRCEAWWGAVLAPNPACLPG